MIDANTEQQNPFVVSLCGPSNAGKSGLAKATAAELGPMVASRVPVDYFFVPRPEMVSLDVFCTCPLQWDWDLLRKRLALLMGTGTSTPDADFDAFQRRADRGGVAFDVRPIMLLDAMAPYPQSDLVVLIDVPEGERLRRVAERDRRWGTRVASRWMHLEETWRHASKGVIPDLVLDGTLPITIEAGNLSQKIRRLFVAHEPMRKEKSP